MSYTYQRTVTSYNLQRRETSIVAPLGVAIATPTTIHNQLTGRDATGAHPAAAITESLTRVFVTPAEKTAIGTAVQPGDLGTPDVAGFAEGDPAKLANIAANANNYTHPDHTGDVTSVGDGAQTIAARAVTAAKMFALATARFLGRVTAGSGDVEQLTAAQLAAALTHADIGTRTAADSHPETAISSAYTALVVAAGAATLTVVARVYSYRRKVDCAGGAVDLSIAGTLEEEMAGDFVLRDAGLITWPVSWKWQTDNGDAPTPAAVGRHKIYWEATEDAAGTGYEIWVWNKGEVDDA